MAETLPFWWDFEEVPVNTGSIMASFADTNLCDVNLMIEVHPDTCNPRNVAPIYFEAQWKPTEFSYDDEYEQNGFGLEVLKRRVVKRIHSFEVVVDKYMHNFIHELIGGNNKLQATSTPLSGGSGTVVFDIFQIEIESEPFDDDLMAVTVRFQTDYDTQIDTFGVNGCCYDLYEDGPYEDPCSGQTSGGGEIADCADATINVTESGGTLTAEVTNFTGPTIQWKYTDTDGNVTILSQNATQVVVGGYGTYRATLNECGIYSEFVYLDPCSALSVQLTQDTASTIVASLTPASGTAVYTFYQWNDGTDSWDQVQTGAGATYVLSEAGLYRVVVTDSGCSTEDTVNAVYTDGCAMTIALDITDGVLTATPTDAPGVVTYTFEVDRGDGDGYVEHQAASGDNTTEVTGTGVYRVTATSGSCTVVETILTVEDCGEEDPNCWDYRHYESVTAVAMTDTFQITAFGLINSTYHSADEINSLYDVYMNQVHLVFDASLMNGYQIDVANNQIITNKQWPAGSILEIKSRE